MGPFFCGANSTHAQCKGFQLEHLVDTKLHIHCVAVRHFDSFTHFGWPLHAKMAFPAKELSLGVLQLRLRLIGQKRSEGGEGAGNKQKRSCQTTCRQPFLAEGLVCKRLFLTFCCCILSRLRDVWALEHSQLTSMFFLWE